MQRREQVHDVRGQERRAWFGISLPVPLGCAKASPGSGRVYNLTGWCDDICFQHGSCSPCISLACVQILSFSFGLVSNSRQFFSPAFASVAAWKWLPANHFCRQGNGVLIAEQVVRVQFDFRYNFVFCLSACCWKVFSAVILL